MAIRETKIDVAGPLHAATAEGLLAEANEINVQEESGDIDLQTKISNTDSIIGIENYPTFNTTTIYKVGDVVRYNGKLYRFIRPHFAGEFVKAETEPWDIVTDWRDNLFRVLDGGNAVSVYGGSREFDCGGAN